MRRDKKTAPVITRTVKSIINQNPF